MNKKIIVLDDDPTGNQTVHGIYVYTTWTPEVLTEAFLDNRNLFYILTNSRSLTEKQTEALHHEILRNIINVAEKTNFDFDIISRSDSTLRGHYPLETNVIREELEKIGKKVDCELIIPFFKEGGRVTEGDIHYIIQMGTKLRVGESEFAKDRTFGYKNSNLKEWIEEKTKGQYLAKDVKSITLEMLRSKNLGAIKNLLLESTNAQKIVVNATDYYDLSVLVKVLNSSDLRKKRCLFRTAASFVKVYGNISDMPLLSGNDIKQSLTQNGGLIIIGSYVDKSTKQLNHLINSKAVQPYELNVSSMDDAQINKIVKFIIKKVNKNIRKGIDSVVYTSRTLMMNPNNDFETNINISSKISNYIVAIIKGITILPRFIIVKGGITSSDIATKGLNIKKALVLGQVLPGVPIWLADENSRFPNIPYVVFPGNVGDEGALTKIYELLVS